MADNTPVSLDDWPSRRPVKLAEPQIETTYASRQDRTKVTLRLPNQVADQLRVWCATTKRTAQDLVTELLVSHFRMDGQTATDHDDLISDDEEKQVTLITSSSTRSSAGRPDGQALTARELFELPDFEREVLLFYRQWTGNHPKHRDRSAFEQVAQLPKHAILAGIGITRLRAKFQIRSLKYCLPEIHNSAELAIGPEYVEHVVRCLRRLATQPNLPTIGAEVAELNARSDHQV
jgi:hypothetical protein